MLLQASAKTGWFHIAVLLLITAAAVLYIRQALLTPFVQWQLHNEVRAAEIKAELDQQ